MILFLILTLPTYGSSDKNILLKFKKFSLEGKVSKGTENNHIAFFYGIPYATLLTKNDKTYIYSQPMNVYGGGGMLGTFQTRSNSPNMCLGADGVPSSNNLCLDFDLFMPTQKTEGILTLDCFQDPTPSFTFIWHVDVLEKNRSALTGPAISLARDSGALVVILYYRSGFLGFLNLDPESHNLGFDDIMKGHLLILRLIRQLCASTERVVYAGNYKSATDLQYLAMTDYPYSGYYALFGVSLTADTAVLRSNQRNVLYQYYGCNESTCLENQLSNITDIADIRNVTDSLVPWLPHTERRPFRDVSYLPVVVGFTACDGCAMAKQWYIGDSFPPTSDDELIEAVKAVLGHIGISDSESTAGGIFDFYMDLGYRNYEDIFCQFVFDSFGMFDIWNSSFDVLREITFVEFDVTSPGCHESRGFSPFDEYVDETTRSLLVDLVSAFSRYNSIHAMSEKWNFSRVRSNDNLIQFIGRNGSVVLGSIMKSRNFDFQRQIRTNSEIGYRSVFKWTDIVTLCFAVLVLVLLCCMIYWIRRSSKSKTNRLIDRSGFGFPGLRINANEHDAYLKEMRSYSSHLTIY